MPIGSELLEAWLAGATPSATRDDLLEGALRYAALHPLLRAEAFEAVRTLAPADPEELGWAIGAVPRVRIQVLRPAIERALARSTSEALRLLDEPHELVIVGEGLAGSALAREVLRRAPEARLLVVDEGRCARPYGVGGAAFRLNTWNTGQTSSLRIL